MKSFDEMTQSVLARAEKERIVRKKRSRVILSAVVSACCLAAVLLMGTQRQTPDPLNLIQDTLTAPSAQQPSDAETNPLSKGNYSIQLLSMSQDGSYVKLVENVTTPLFAQFRIRDVRGLTDAEINEVRREESLAANAVFAQIKGDSTIGQYWGKTAVITVLFVGRISVMIDDFTQVEDVSITCTDVGNLCQNSLLYRNSNRKLYETTWRPSEKTQALIEEDPSIKPSQFRDTITFTITYKDGTVVTKMVDISFDDEGYAYIVQRDDTAQNENTWAGL